MLRKLLFLTCVTGLFSLAGLFASPAMAQSTIQGTVTDSLSGNTLVGTSIFVLGTQRGAVTDANGHYEIDNLSPGTYKVRASFIGYNTKVKTVTVGNGVATVNFQLVSTTSTLNQVVVTAFGLKESKRSIPYQTAKIGTKDLESSGSVSPVSELAGKVSGLTITRTGGGVNPSLNIRLRGLRSITGSSAPLIVIDGVIASKGAFEQLNSQDIKSINVLKSGSAAAIYGSDASNGVIIITTKTGNRNGQFTVGFQNSTLWKTISIMPDHQTKFGSGIKGVYVPFENTSWGPRFDGQSRRIGNHFPAGYPLDDQFVPYAYAKNNLRRFYQPGMTLQNTLYFSGGGDTGSFYMSAGYTGNKGIIPDNQLRKFTFTANAKQSFNDITVSLHSSYNSHRSNVVGDDVGNQDRFLKWFVINTPLEIPLWKYKDWQNPLSYAYPANYYNRYYLNPYSVLGRNRQLNKSHRLRANLTAAWDIIDNISLTGTLGINAGWNNGKHRRARQNYPLGIQVSRTAFPAYVNISEHQFSTINGNIIAKGNFQLSNTIGLQATAGAAVQMYRLNQSEIDAHNLSIPGFFDISNGTGTPTVFSYTEVNRTYGVFGKLKFNYNKWAYLLLTGRQDFTSTLPLDNDSYFYPSIGASFILSSAIPSLEDSPFLSFLKITFSNATVYNDLDPYQVNEVYTQVSDFPFGSVNAFRLQNSAIDPNIKKEKINETEVGLNAGFFNGRLNLDASWYYNQTTNLITSVSSAYASGAASFLTNIGQLHNTGFGISIRGDIIRRENLRFSLGFNLAHSEQVVDELKGDNKKTSLGNHRYAVVGQPFPVLRVLGYKRDTTGTYKGRIIVDKKTGIPVPGGLVNMGQVFPNYTLALNPTISYKGLTVRATMDYRFGFVYYSYGIADEMFTGHTVLSAASNRQPFVFPNSVYDKNPDPNATNYVPNTNIPITIPSISYFTNQYNANLEHYVRDGKEFKLRKVSINYVLPKRWYKKTALSNITVGLIGRNLFIWTPTDQTRFSDPEFRGGYVSPPATRSFGFNVNVEF